MPNLLNESGNSSIPLIAEDPAMKRVVAEAERLAEFDTTTVLIEGETGTGKEMIARHIHSHSPRKDRPFIVLDCATIPQTLMESVLFGHEKGAFTGATTCHEGLLEQAEGGILLIDELASLDEKTQAMLLRFLEAHEVQRIGDGKPKRLDVRILAASNRDLSSLVTKGNIRLDLFHRVSIANLYLPPLRERPVDIIAMFIFYLDYWSRQHGMLKPTISEEALDILRNYPWPGNAREVRNVSERTIINNNNIIIDDISIASSIFRPSFMHYYEIGKNHGGLISQPLFLQRLLCAWIDTDAHVTKTANLTGVSKASVSYYSKILGLSKNEPIIS